MCLTACEGVRRSWKDRHASDFATLKAHLLDRFGVIVTGTTLPNPLGLYFSPALYGQEAVMRHRIFGLRRENAGAATLGWQPYCPPPSGSRHCIVVLPGPP